MQLPPAWNVPVGSTCPEQHRKRHCARLTPVHAHALINVPCRHFLEKLPRGRDHTVPASVTVRLGQSFAESIRRFRSTYRGNGLPRRGQPRGAAARLSSGSVKTSGRAQARSIAEKAAAVDRIRAVLSDRVPLSGGCLGECGRGRC
jgi:hypothetical protein